MSKSDAATLISVIILHAGQFGAGAAAGAGLYSAPSDWKVEVVAEAPQLRSPTAITVAPDGRIFVAEDPIDMEGPDDQSIDRVLCFHPDGHRTVFAENLGCAFGLQYLDGKLYVNHPPIFSVFRDDGGVGRDRVDLLRYPNPRQTLAGSITHIPGNVRLAMDGFLYMAVGDSGLYKARGPDGTEFTLRGGGIVRFRPDGTGIEVFSTGTRNHPDVAINAEDELFTYDNTDDGEGWWTRVTHMVDGGFYGYPWDYRPQRPYTLWMMGDFGGGGGTASFAYNEDSLPEEYRGNLFLGDYARAQLLRLRVVRQGATYRIVSRNLHDGRDFLTVGASDFRPIGMAVSPDGSSLYVTDWNTIVSRVPAQAGRLLKLTYLGKSRAATRPAWFPAAGTGSPFNASTDELLTALRHPSHAVRMVTQRRLAERGAEAVQRLTALLEDRSAPAHARWHALWALDAIDAGQAARQSVMAQLKDNDPSVRRQAARQLGTRRAAEAAGALGILLKDSDASVRFHAATALGRIGSTSSVAVLLPALDEKDLFARYGVFHALHRIGMANSDAWTDIVANLDSPSATIREGCLFSLHEAYSLPLVHLLAAFLARTNVPLNLRVAVLEQLGELARREAEWHGEWWSGGVHPVNRPRTPKTVDWEGTPTATAPLRAALQDSAKPVRLAALTGLRRANDAASISAIRVMIDSEHDFEVLQSAMLTLGELKDPGLPEFLDSLSRDPASIGRFPLALAAAEKIASPAVVQKLIQMLQPRGNDAVFVPTMQTLVNLKAGGAVPALGRLISHRDTSVWNGAIQALVQLGGDDAVEALAPNLTNHNPTVRQTIVFALASTKIPAAIPALLEAYRDEALRPAAFQGLVEMPDPRALDVYVNALTNQDSVAAQASLHALTSLPSDCLARLEEQMLERSLPPAIRSSLEQRIGAGRVQDWFLLGPLPDTSLDEKLAAMLAPSSGAAITNASGRWPWTHAIGKPLSGRIAPRAALKIERATNAIVYAAAQVAGTGKEEVCALVFDTDAPCAVWLNGKKVFTSPPNPLPWRFRAILRPGQNALLARFSQAEKAAQLSVRVIPERNDARASPNTYVSYAREHMGNPVHGKQIFEDSKKMSCLKCHGVAGRGGTLGPDLAGIGTKFNREQLADAVVFPSHQNLIGYQQTSITTTAGDTFIGLVQKDEADIVELVEAGGPIHRLSKSQIQRRKLSDVSFMPEGLHAAVGLQDFADLISYLASLR